MSNIKWVDWKVIDAKYPSKLDKDALTEAEFRKQRTVELYDYLPQTTLEDRATYLDIRDAIIEMNYTFFGYIAAHKFVNNSYISYEDKFQSALFHFCELWMKYRYEKGKYRTDVAFGVFFKPRITECMERELDEVKYSLRRALCMEAGNQLGKHWTKVTYDDLKDVDLTYEKKTALQAIFGSMYVADLDTHALFIQSEDKFIESIDHLYTDNYDSIEDMLIREMVDQEKNLEDDDLKKLSDLLCIPFEKLKEILPKAKEKLYNILVDKVDLRDTFN